MDLSEETTTFTLEDILKTQHFDFHKTYPIDKVFPHPNNPRKHSEYEIELLEIGIMHFGFTNPILIQKNTNIVIAGHARLKAAIKLGLKGIPVRIWDCSDEEAEAHMIADNKISQHSDWDEEHLIPLLMKWRDKTDKNLTGFSEEEMQLLINSQHDPSDLDDDEMIYEPPVVPITQPGDLWILGKHRLLCGDATNADDVGRLLNGTRPFLMVTDPPYGVEYDANWRNEVDRKNGKPYGASAIGKVQNDEQCDWRKAWALFHGEVAYIWHASGHAKDVLESLESVGFTLRTQIIWNKSTFAISRSHYHHKHDPCFYVHRQGTSARWIGGHDKTTVWDIPKNARNDSGHSTQKPVECMRRPMLNHSSDGQPVYDPFLGSGTTITAAESIGQVCYGLEISPAYCDVIIQRWETLTGLKAEKANGRTTT